MRRLLFAAAVLAAGCASPRPCTQALCPLSQDGSYRVSGWNKAVTVEPGAVAIPVVADSSVEVLSGKVEFLNDRAVVRATAGASFRFEVSSASAHAASIVVSSGDVSVALSSTSAGAPVAPGATFVLPAAK